MAALTLTSPAFQNDGRIPAKYTCDGDERLSPPLSIVGLPERTASLALIMDDPDIPATVREARDIGAFDHWVVYNIPVRSASVTIEIPEGAVVAGEAGLNSVGETRYVGPCPPPQYEPREHRYVFTLYALRGILRFDAPPTKKEVLDALAPLLIEKTAFVGRYSRR